MLLRRTLTNPIARLALSAVALISAALPAFAQIAPNPPNPPYQRVYIFGDSYSDTGAGYLDGNGPTAVAYMAKSMNIDLKPASANHGPGDSLNFAVSGATTGEGKGSRVQTALLGYGMKNQVQDFVQGINSKSIRFDPTATLFFLAGGLNDARFPPDVTLNNLKDEIRTLYRAGGRNFAVALLTTRIPGFGQLGQRLNGGISQIPQQLMSELKGAHIYASHWGPFFDEILQNPTRYGITNTKDACAGRKIFGEKKEACAAPDTYFYYHAEHPSTATHKAVGQMLYEEAVRMAPPSSPAKTKGRMR